MDYRSESRALDAELLRIIAAWRNTNAGLTEPEFDALALRLFAYQIRYNAPYAAYCTSLGFSESALPHGWAEIPPVPAAAFKEAALATFDAEHAALTFETSGTTRGVAGRHYMETAALYDAALLAGFEHFVLADGARLRYFNLVPNPQERPRSSLGYMMNGVSHHFGDDRSGWYLREDQLLFEPFTRDLAAAIAADLPVCIAATAFAFVNLCDALRARGERFHLPAGSRMMETGGFKGRTRTLSHAQLYTDLAGLFDIDPARIVAEYGMTELTSQWYDVNSNRVKRAPPWLRARVVGADGKSLAYGTVGSIVHVDLANRSSCLAIQTEDLGALSDAGLILLGREEGAALRGCSLDAETLRLA
jgi:hypothetical protein